MTEPINILIASAGTRNKVVQAFRETLAGRGSVIATDASPYAPALYDADRACVVPRITDPAYIDILLDICRKERVSGILSLIDPELSLLAANRDRFLAIGVTPMVSPFELCELCLDKFRMYWFLTEKGIRTAACWNTLKDFRHARQDGLVDFPVFVKPQRGSASIGISRVDNEETVHTLFRNAAGSGDNPMVQELMRGQEYGCDAYIDLLSGRCTGLFLKKKLRMRAGETDKSVSVKDAELMRRLAAFLEESGFRGAVDIDLFHDEHGQENDTSAVPEGEWYLSEINPRFGGGYPHAYACGVNYAQSFIVNLTGRESGDQFGQYETGVVMMKYNDTAIRREEELAQAEPSGRSAAADDDEPS